MGWNSAEAAGPPCGLVGVRRFVLFLHSRSAFAFAETDLGFAIATQGIVAIVCSRAAVAEKRMDASTLSNSSTASRAMF